MQGWQAGTGKKQGESGLDRMFPGDDNSSDVPRRGAHFADPIPRQAGDEVLDGLRLIIIKFL